MKKILLTRFGGIGDLAPVTVVANQLKKQGWHVTLACRDGGKDQRQSDLLYENPAFDQVLDLKEVGPWRDRCVKTQLGWLSVNAVYNDFTRVIDFRNVVESNNTSPTTERSVGEEWQSSRNSNWRDWVDLHLEWANIDPTKVPSEEKRPIFTLRPGEENLFKRLKETFKQVFVIQASASSLSRTWYQAEKMPRLILKEYPEACVVFWDNKTHEWLAVSQKGAGKLPMPENHPKLRTTMALLSVADVFIGADTGFTHVAEALNIPHVAIYSTVPAWTRAKHYKNQIAIDPGVDNHEYYTFSLGLGDPLRVLEGRASLTEREKMVEDLYKVNATESEAAEVLNTSEEGAKYELQSFMAKQASWERMQSKALSTVTPEMVLEKVKELVLRKGLT